MKNKIIILSAFLMMFCAMPSISGQINRTLETKVADILAQLPTEDVSQSSQLMQKIIDLETEGILQFCDMLVPSGTGDDTQVRYALHSLATYSGSVQNTIDDNIVENAFIKAIENATDNEIKTFLIRRLAFCGSDTSVRYLNNYLFDANLYKPSLASMTSIGTTEAKQAILKATKLADVKSQPAFIDALGALTFEKSVGVLQDLSNENSVVIRQKSLMALAEIAVESSNATLYNAAKKSNFNSDESKAIEAYAYFGKRLSDKGNKTLSNEVAENILKNCNAENQLHFRSVAIHILRANKGTDFTKTLIKEAKNSNINYRGSVLDVASQNMTSDEVLKWVKAYKKSSDGAKAQIINMLSKKVEKKVYDKVIVPSLDDENSEVRIAGIKALVYQEKSISLPVLLEALDEASSEAEYKAVEGSLLRVCSSEDSNLLTQKLSATNNKGKVVLIHVLSARNATSQFDTLVALVGKSASEVDEAIYTALPSIATSKNLSKLIELLDTADGNQNVKSAQEAIIYVLDNSDPDNSKVVFEAFETNKKERVLPILSAIDNKESLGLVVTSLNSNNDDEKKIALETLSNWRNNDALPYIFLVASTSNNNELQATSFSNYLSQVTKSSYHDDQKLLLIKKLTSYSKSIDQDKEIIKSVQNIKTFLSLVFVSKYMDKEGLKSSASHAVIRIALPSSGNKNGLTGTVVREIITKSIDNLSGLDSPYIVIVAKEFLDGMSNEKGFVSIFNEKDLTGWEGLVKNPIERGKMSEKELAKAQIEANEIMSKFWFVKDGVIGFKGEGYNNICTIKDYGDFEMLVDWKIANGGDSGIYLRGTPQVQIWDIARVNVGAQVGSGGLYNNKVNESIPLELADNPINDWNTFRIKMVGERVTVHLNGILVTDNVILENYWDRALPIFTKEAIELQAHGEDLGFRNIYVREINSGDDLLSAEEQKAGFKSLFNGKDLDHWIGNKIDYYAENNEILARPSRGGHGNMFTAEEYSDFIFRFEFKLTSGANNGLGIHAPLKGDAAYDGKEIQILDNTAAIYANLKPYQYHGSVYGVIAAKRSYLNPVGEWNYEEVHVVGDHITVTLNGTVILDGNMKEASKNGPLDGKKHSGLNRNKGHIGFLGHGSELEFRNIRIKDLSK